MNSWEREAKSLKKEEDHQKGVKRMKKEEYRKRAEEDKKRKIAEDKEKIKPKIRTSGNTLPEIQIQLEDDLKMSTTDSSTDDEDQSRKRAQ